MPLAIHWDEKMIEDICFGTTATNTGRQNGACILLEQKVDQVLGGVSLSHLENNAGSCVPPSTWYKMNRKNFKSRISDQFIF